jgi:hypothetical protein
MPVDIPLLNADARARTSLADVERILPWLAVAFYFDNGD